MLESQQALACLDFFPHDHLQHAVQGNRHELTTTCLSVCMSGNLSVCLSACVSACHEDLFVCRDHAMTLVSQHIPKQTHHDKHRALQTAARHLLSKGTFIMLLTALYKPSNTNCSPIQTLTLHTMKWQINRTGTCWASVPSSCCRLPCMNPKFVMLATNALDKTLGYKSKVVSPKQHLLSKGSLLSWRWLKSSQ